MAAAAVSREAGGAEGVEGNVHASRAWKGNCGPSGTSPCVLPSYSEHNRNKLAFRIGY